jgi:hypothetical protein
MVSGPSTTVVVFSTISFMELSRWEGVLRHQPSKEEEHEYNNLQKTGVLFLAGFSQELYMQSKSQKFIEAIQTYPDVSIFQVVDDSNEDDPQKWTLLALIDDNILHESEGFYILKAKQILSKQEVHDCYISMVMPECVADYVFFIEENRLINEYLHECKGDIICAVPINYYCNYELFYSKIDPEVGIQVLRNGLNSSGKKGFIAEALGYILRDEARTKEAITAFRYSVDEGPTSDYIYFELMQLYEKVGDTKNADYYQELAKSVINTAEGPHL